ncbi:MAG: NAD(P)H-binding protein [Pseudomonadota bacterium]
MTKFAVTAASGTLGRACVSYLSERQGALNVRAVARTPSKASDLGVEVRCGVYGDKQSLMSALADVDAVLVISSNDAPENRREQHKSAFEAARDAGVRRIVYTSVQGPERGGGFANIVESNRVSEDDLRQCGVEWVIARNGIYIEPDLDYIDTYKRCGVVQNCAGEGRCGYVARPELAAAYARLLSEPTLAGGIYNLHNEPISQTTLAALLSKASGAAIEYQFVDSDEFRKGRVAELGPFYGAIVAGIYEGIAKGAFDGKSDFAQVLGRPHVPWRDYVQQYIAAK